MIDEKMIIGDEDASSRFDSAVEAVESQVEKAHAITIDLSLGEEYEPAPVEFKAGTRHWLRAVAGCEGGCPLPGVIEVAAESDGVVFERLPLRHLENGLNETEIFEVDIPKELGKYAWVLRYLPAVESDDPAAKTPVEPSGVNEGAELLGEVFDGEASSDAELHDVDTFAHQTTEVVYSYTVLAHVLGLSANVSTSPVSPDDNVVVNVVAKCECGCNLGGVVLRLCDESGACLLDADISEDPDSVDCIHRGAYEIGSFEKMGLHCVILTVDSTNLELRHEATSHRIAFAVEESPDCLAKVLVVDKDSLAPLAKARVTVVGNSGIPYRGTSDAEGVVEIPLPFGDYSALAILSDYRKATSSFTASEESHSVTLEMKYNPDLGG